MLRLSSLAAVLTFMASLMVDASAAHAVVCSEEVCISRCFTAGGRHCLKGCDRRIARRVASGVCPWYGPNWVLDRQASLATRF
jgi:hypothetical protein